jgi:hypothetical protein
VACNNATFGDPAPGLDKTCEYETVSTPPAAPQNVQATAGDGQISLNWGAASGATAYNVYRSTVAGGEGTTPYRSGVASTTFTDTGLTNGTTYFYRISATNGTTESPLSSEVSATPVATTSQWAFCANEDGTCTFTGTRRVRYGISGQYSILTKTSPVACNNATFGDPAPGLDKTCEYETVSTPPAPLAAPRSVQTTSENAISIEAWQAVVEADGVQRVRISCGSNFFDPREIVVKKDVPLDLIVRTTNKLPRQNFLLLLPGQASTHPIEPASRPIRFLPSAPGQYVMLCRTPGVQEDEKSQAKKRGILHIRP